MSKIADGYYYFYDANGNRVGTASRQGKGYWRFYGPPSDNSSGDAGYGRPAIRPRPKPQIVLPVDNDVNVARAAVAAQTQAVARAEAAVVAWLKQDPAYAAAEARVKVLSPAGGAAAEPDAVHQLAEAVGRLSKLKQAAIDGDPAVSAARAPARPAERKLADLVEPSAPGLSPRAVLEQLAAIQMVDV